MDFGGDGQLASLMTSGRLFDVHKNLPSKGRNIQSKRKRQFFAYSERR
jgi:hypothetical protein